MGHSWHRVKRLKKCQKSLVLPMKNVPVCTFKTSPFVPAPRAHVLKDVCAWCRYTRGRFERTHGDVLSGDTEFRSVSHTNTHTLTHTTHTIHNTTTQHNTTKHNTLRPQHHTEKERDRDRQRQRKKTGTGTGEERRRKRREKTREEKTKEDKTRQEKREN